MSSVGPDRSRRAVLATAFAAFAGLALPVGAIRRRSEPTIVVLTATDGSARRGALLGIEEAEHAATLLRTRLRLVHLESQRDGDPTESASERPEWAVALVRALQSPAALSAEAAASTAGRLVIDGCATHGAPPCHPLVFRVGVPEDGGELRGAAPVLWHHSFERYGARQLNERFHRRFGQEMDGAAWAAWFAVKVTAEVTQRVPDATPDALARALVGSAGAFDGHKGRPLRFSPESHVLQQPLYEIVPGADGRAALREIAVSDAAAAVPCTTSGAHGPR